MPQVDEQSKLRELAEKMNDLSIYLLSSEEKINKIQNNTAFNFMKWLNCKYRAELWVYIMKRAAFTLHDLKQHLQLSHNTIYKAIDPLIAYNLVEEAETLKLRKKGRQTTLYKLPWATDGQVEAARRLYHDSKVGGVTLSLEEHIRRQGYEAIVEDILMAHRDTFGDRSEEAPVEKKIFNRIVENSEHGDYRDREEIRRILWKEHGVTCIR